MKVAFDAQFLFDEQKTGIGWNSKAILDAMIEDGSVDIQLNVHEFRPNTEYDKMLEDYEKKGCRIKRNRIMPAGLYYKITEHIPIPYSTLFGSEADITQFFNFVVPPGVHTCTGTYIYDMAYKAFPDTVRESERKRLDQMQKYCDRSDFIITISEFSKNEIIRYLNIDPKKITVIPCAVDHRTYRPDYTEEEKETAKKKYGIPEDYILYLGTLEPRKNIPLLIEAYGLLKKENPDVPKLVLAGKKGWLYDEIFSKVREHCLERDVIFTGYVMQEDSPKLMAGAKLFVFPSKYEGFGMPPLEAMACGTPVVISNSDALVEVTGGAAAVSKIEDADNLKKEMENILGTSELQNKMKERGLIQAAKFTAEKSAKDLIQVCRMRTEEY